MAKKTWKRPKQILMGIGPCRYCKKDMVNTESFVAFHIGKPKFAHYACMKKDDELRNAKLKEIENNIDSVLNS
tara:strand:- start:1133 stop:1351 length:219 start_codon:yes stop_codon:yes gene_type:complete